MNSPLSNTQAPADSRPDAHTPSSPNQTLDRAPLRRSDGSDARLAADVASSSGPVDQADGGCCTPIDKPEIGLVHDDACEFRGKAVATGRRYVAGEVPEPLRSLVEGAAWTSDLAQLAACSEFSPQVNEILLAARALGAVHVHGTRGSWCDRCAASALPGDQLRHHSACALDRLERAVAALAANATLYRQRKEAAPDEDRAGAGDGIPPRRSLTDAAEGLRQAALAEMGRLGNRSPWQCNACGSAEVAATSYRDIVHAADCWVGNALVVLSSDDLESGECGGLIDRTDAFEERQDAERARLAPLPNFMGIAGDQSREGGAQ